MTNIDIINGHGHIRESNDRQVRGVSDVGQGLIDHLEGQVLSQFAEVAGDEPALATVMVRVMEDRVSNEVSAVW